MKIALGCDHGGINLKNEIIKYLESEGYEFKDFGTYTTDSCDYPDYALPVAEAVANKEFDFGILICGTGIGIGIAANKVPGIRAALCSSTTFASLARKHNDANVLILPGRFISKKKAIRIVKVFLTTNFEGGRHARRVKKLKEL